MTSKRNENFTTFIEACIRMEKTKAKVENKVEIAKQPGKEIQFDVMGRINEDNLREHLKLH